MGRKKIENWHKFCKVCGEKFLRNSIEGFKGTRRLCENCRKKNGRPTFQMQYISDKSDYSLTYCAKCLNPLQLQVEKIYISEFYIDAKCICGSVEFKVINITEKAYINFIAGDTKEIKATLRKMENK